MARASTSLDLSEFFNNDDSQGNRLIEYLQKRRGCVQRQKFLFMNNEPQRLSLNVQLEKLPKLQQEASSNFIERQIETDKIETNSKCTMEPEKQNIQHCTADESSSKSNARTNVEADAGTGEQRVLGEPSSPIQPFIPQNPVLPISPNYSSFPVSSAVKSGGSVSKSDRLRRYSLKRLTKQCGGRRTLLQEFESTIGDINFEPPICSTPLSQPHQEKQSAPVNTGQPLEATNCKPNSPKSCDTNQSDSSNTHTLIRTLKHKDEELKGYMESLLEKTVKHIQCLEKENNENAVDKIKSNMTLHAAKPQLKRTYTVEKGNMGQLILTPDKCTTNQSLQFPCKLLRSQERNVTRKNLRSLQRYNTSCPLIRSNFSIQSSKNMDASRTCEHQQEVVSANPKSTVVELLNSPQQTNVSIELPLQTQEQPNVRESSITMRRDIREVPIVVIPIKQTFNSISGGEIRNNTREKTTTKEDKKNSPTLPAQFLKAQVPETNVDQSYQIVEEDNLKITDILTEDEDETVKDTVSSTTENYMQPPLNLAQRITNLQKRSLQKHNLRKTANSQLYSVNTEIEPLSKSESSKRIAKRKQIPLNKAPGIPLNGEKFAKELSRMSNYEILDLRKRNSMGHVFVISGHKSRLLQEEATKKQYQLGHQIENELLKRNLDEISGKQSVYSDEANVEEDGVEECFPVPDEFRDSTLNRQQDHNDDTESSLIDEKSSDRVRFKNKTNLRSARFEKKPLPEILEQYLEVSRNYSHNRKRSLNKSKRSLYTQGYPEEEEKTPSNSRIKKRNIPYILPIKSGGDQIATMKIVSPPPANITLQKFARHEHQKYTTNQVDENSHDATLDVAENVILPAPPPELLNDPIVGSNNNFNHSTTRSKIQTDKTITNSATHLNTNYNADKDEQIFKKPDKPAPKNYRKRIANTIPSNDLKQCEVDSQQLVNKSDDTTNGTLRRSKRGQVPIKYSIFQVLFQQALDKRLQYFAKKEKSENNKSNYKESISSSETRKRGMMEKQLPNNSKADPPRKKAKKSKESKVKSKQKKVHQKITGPNENMECSGLTLTTPLPFDNFNNVFDEVRNTSSTPNITSQMAPTKAPAVALSSKLKSVKVRVARLKSFRQPVYQLESGNTISTDINKNLNFELISWLKNMKESDSSAASNSEIFKEMRISAASNLSFTALQGVEYAFYDTADKASVGYLRFKPHQKKPRKRAKRFILHFVALEGKFRIITNGEESQIGVGDMVAIEKLAYYDIENLTGDIAILMVIKK